MKIEKSAACLFTAVNYSAGRQSEWLLESILRGEITVHQPHVFNANPGMERIESLERVESMRVRCSDAGIYFETCDGPNLFEDLISGNCREHPPYFTDERGMIQHHCTREYKIYPIRRAIRRVLRSRFHMKGTYPGCVDSFICFGAEEFHRIKTKKREPKYITLRYPLVEMDVTTDDVARDFRRWGLEMPTPSLCNGCFANGLNSYKNMRPEELNQAIAVDEAIRNHKFSGLKANQLFVSNTMLPLVQLRDAGWSLGDEIKDDKFGCDSGMCFN